jgi:hypothetical protein
VTYTGIFIRQFLGQQPNQPSSGSCGCPDIIFEGQGDQGPGPWQPLANYNNVSPADIYFNARNYVYLRGYQAGTTNGSNLWLYTVPCSLALWPQNWSAANITVYGSEGKDNHAWAPPQPGNPVVVNDNALVWTPTTIDTNVQHYCAIAWADNSTQDNPVPPPFDQWTNLNSFDDLMLLLASNPNMGWRNTIDHPQPPPNNQYTTGISTQDNPESVYITVYFNGLPTDGTFIVNVTGDVTFTSGALSVGNYLGGYPVNPDTGLFFDANQQAQLIVTYTAGQTQPSQFAFLSAEIDHYLSQRSLDLLVAAVEPPVTLPIRTEVGMYGVTRQKFPLGRTQWNLNWGTGVQA